MQAKLLSLALLAGAAVAQQTQGLNETLAANENLTQLATFLGQFPDLLSSLAGAQNITVLAPSNQAFETFLNSSAAAGLASNPDLIQAVLQYHVLNGTFYSSQLSNVTSFLPTLLTNEAFANVSGGQRVEAAIVDGNAVFFSGLFQNSTVSQADQNFTGGTIHIIDTLLTLPVSVSATALAGGLSSLYGALGTAGLVDTVDQTPDLTIFAPTNEAFQAIGSAVGSLSTEELASILTYHVVNGTVGYSGILENGTTLQTVNGAELTIRFEADGIFVNNAKVVLGDILVANGVVHVIDNVLNPNATTVEPSDNATVGAPAFSGASSVSEVPFTSGVPTPTQSLVTEAPAPPGGSGSPTGASSTAGAMPMITGAAGQALLFGGAAAAMMF